MVEVCVGTGRSVLTIQVPSHGSDRTLKSLLLFLKLGEIFDLYSTLQVVGGPYYKESCTFFGRKSLYGSSFVCLSMVSVLFCPNRLKLVK